MRRAKMRAQQQKRVKPMTQAEKAAQRKKKALTNPSRVRRRERRAHLQAVAQ